MARRQTPKPEKKVESFTHEASKRRNIPPKEMEAVAGDAARTPIRVAYERRNADLDPQLVWRGKEAPGDDGELVTWAPPIYIQEKIHPKVLVEDLRRETLAAREKAQAGKERQADLFADFNGIPEGVDKTDYYQHDQNWSNRMILGDSLQVMASLAEKEGLRGQVQCIYFDPPYGIRFNSNFQWSTTSREVKDGNAAHITREPEQVKAFRDTWRDGIHSYLGYLRDRLTVARELLNESGSIFVQIGEENVHRLHSILDEVFGDNNFIGLIWFRKKTMPLGATYLERMGDYILWFGKDIEQTKFNRLFKDIDITNDFHWNWRQASPTERIQYSKENLAKNPSGDPLRLVSMWPASFSAKDVYPLNFKGRTWTPPRGQCYPTTEDKLIRLTKADRIEIEGNNLRYVMKLSDDSTTKLNLTWGDTVGARDQHYVVETSTNVIQRCILMASGPGDLVLDPTCGSGTTAYVAEQWGRRWITIDTSRVALALARARIMGARYPYYLLADSREGQLKEADITGAFAPSSVDVSGDLRLGFVYERVPHITLKAIANNAEIDVIWDKWQDTLEPLRTQLNAALNQSWEEWQIPRDTEPKWSDKAQKLHAAWWDARIARQKEIDASIARKADFEFLYDKPYEDKKRVRVAGPFTVESISPHRTLDVGPDDELIDPLERAAQQPGKSTSYEEMILDNLRTAGIQQAHKADRIAFETLVPWPGRYVAAEGRYREGNKQRRAAVFIGPEFGTVQRNDLVTAAREAAEADFDILIACGFSFEAHAGELEKLGRLPILQTRMNADLHMARDLKNTGKGNLFVVFGEPDIDLLKTDDGQLQIKLNGIDVFDPSTGDVRSDSTDGIACWFVDTDYNGESFFVRQAYFLGAADPYKSLKTTLKAEIDEDAWASLHSDLSRPFDKPKSGHVAVKVINTLGDEVMKIFRSK